MRSPHSFAIELLEPLPIYPSLLTDTGLNLSGSAIVVSAERGLSKLYRLNRIMFRWNEMKIIGMARRLRWMESISVVEQLLLK